MSFIAISNIVGTIDEALNYQMDAVAAYSGKPGVTFVSSKPPENCCGERNMDRKASIIIVKERTVVTSDSGSRRPWPSPSSTSCL